jgi:hypothetical protein
MEYPLLNNFAESFLQPNSRSASKEIHRLLWYPKVVHYHVHKSPAPDPILSQMNPSIS